MNPTENEDRTVHAAAAAVWRRFRAYIEYLDLQQEAYAWLLKHEEKIMDWREGGRTGERALRTSLERYLTHVGIKEKAARLGCRPDDFYRYRKGEVEAFLKGMFHNLRETHSRGPRGDIVSSKTVVDPIPVELLDIERAWQRLDIDHRLLLSSLLDADKDEERVAGELDISVAALRKRKSRALRRMQTFLNDGVDDGEVSGRRQGRDRHALVGL